MGVISVRGVGWRALAAVTSAALLLGCGSTTIEDLSPDAADAAGGPSGDSPASPDTSMTGPGRAAIGAAGGVVRLGGASINVPPGALTATTIITISVSGAPPPPGYELRSALYAFGPAGLTFAVPAEVALPYGGGSAPSVYWSRASGGGYDRLATLRTGSIATAEVTHFSTGFVGSPAGSPDGGSMPDAPGDVASSGEAAPDAPVADAPSDVPAPDSSSGDATLHDASTGDVTLYDTGTVDATLNDAGTVDTTPGDSTLADTSATDSSVDSTVTDTTPSDVALDAGPGDGTIHDAAPDAPLGDSAAESAADAGSDATCPSGPVVTLYKGSAPNSLSLTSSDVFFVDVAGTVGKISKTDCAVTTLASGQDTPVSVVTTGGYVYWTNNNAGGSAGTIMRVAVGGGTPTTLASAQTSPDFIATDGTNLYWTTQGSAGSIYEMPVGGGSITSLAATTLPGGVTVYGGVVYWSEVASPGWMSAVPVGGGSATVLTSGGGGDYGAVTDGKNLFYQNGTVNQLSLAADAGPPLALVPFQNLGALTTDGKYVYYGAGSGPYEVMKVPVGGGTSLTMAGAPASVVAIVVDSTSIYFAGGGQVQRVTPK